MRKTTLLTSSALALLASLTAGQTPSIAQYASQPRTQAAPAPNATRAGETPTVGTAITPASSAVPQRISSDVPLTDTQRGKISMILSSERTTPAAVADLPLKAGTVVPATVLIKAVQPEIAAVEPAFRGKSYFVTPDAIVIVSPGNREIVSAFSFSDSEQALVPAATTRTAVTLTAVDREIIRKQLVLPAGNEGPAAKVTTPPGSVVAGDTVPSSVALQEFPPSVSGVAPDVKLYRYYQVGQNVVIVDPDQRRVLEVIQ
jgi:hypothetical protein